MLGTDGDGAEDPETRATVAWHEEPPEGKLDLLVSRRLPDDLDDPALRRRAARGDLVREARPVLDRHAPVRARVQSRDRPAVGGAHRLRGLPRRSPGGSPSWPRTHLGTRKDLVERPAAARHPGRDRQPVGSRTARPTPVPGRHADSGGRARLHRDRRQARQHRAARRLARLHGQERHLSTSSEQVEALGHSNGVMSRGAGAGRPAIDTDKKMAEAILRLLRHHQRRARRAGIPDARAAGRQAAARPGRGVGGEADQLRRHPGGAGAGDHLAGVVRVGDRRTALRAVHRQHRTPQAVPHADRPDALLPRPRLDDRPRRGAADLPATAGHATALRRARARPGRGEADHGALPDAALEVVHPLRVPGQPVHAVAVAAAVPPSG